MSLRTFRNLQRLRDSGLDVPTEAWHATLEQDERGNRWELDVFQEGDREVWTLVLLDDDRALQWRDGERIAGLWVPDRKGIQVDEGDLFGLFGLKGRPISREPDEDEDPDLEY